MTVLALTGTPGTGKTTLADLLEDHGWHVVPLGDLVDAGEVPSEEDPARATRVVDLDRARDVVAPRVDAARGADEDLVLEGHWAHDLALHDVVAVLRCHPGVLEDRLRARGWDAAKARENAEAEALGAVAAEARDDPAAFEVDTTDASPEATLEALLEGVASPEDRDPPGTLDWIAEAPGWF